MKRQLIYNNDSSSSDESQIIPKLVRVANIYFLNLVIK